jgi:hypothetical protein
MKFYYPEGYEVSAVMSLSGDLTVSGDITGERVFNAVYNDIAEFRALADGTPLEFGKCYIDTLSGLVLSDVFCQKGIAGVSSDTYGFALGKASGNMVPLALAGWVLAKVDQEYEIGTPLTCTEDGVLTEITRDHKLEYPERIVATYQHKPEDTHWQPSPKLPAIEISGRAWVKIK